MYHSCQCFPTTGLSRFVGNFQRSLWVILGLGFPTTGSSRFVGNNMRSVGWRVRHCLPDDWVKSFCWKPSLPCNSESDAVADFPTTGLSRFAGDTCPSPPLAEGIVFSTTGLSRFVENFS